MGYSRKQANVIYRAMKEGKIEVDKEVMNKIYEYAGQPIALNHYGWGAFHAISAAAHEITMRWYRDAQQSIASFAYNVKNMEELEAFNARNRELLAQRLRSEA